LEGSKAFAKQFMIENHVPTADFCRIESAETAIKYVKLMKEPFVIKADGLAAGKGVFVCDTLDEQLKAIGRIMKKKEFGDAGRTIIIEKKLKGVEASIMAVCDGEHFVCLSSSQDHKPIYASSYDRIGYSLSSGKWPLALAGENTGGMGVIAPSPYIGAEMQRIIENTIIKPTLEGMAKRGTPYKGCLYVGLMLTDKGPQVLEYNCRFGDPETQALMMLLDTPLEEIIDASINGGLDRVKVVNKPGAVCGIVAASRNYPDKPEDGFPIKDDLKEEDGIVKFYAGVAMKDGQLVTSGGRVFMVAAHKPTLDEARRAANLAICKMSFEGMYHRTDIGVLS
ncbi:MAG: phosphoribosylamine--glycine ligase, partial [archaeon]